MRVACENLRAFVCVHASPRRCIACPQSIKAQDEQTRREQITAGARVTATATCAPLVPRGLLAEAIMRVVRYFSDHTWSTRKVQTDPAVAAAANVVSGSGIMADMEADEGEETTSDEGDKTCNDEPLDPGSLTPAALRDGLQGRHVEVLWPNSDLTPLQSVNIKVGTLVCRRLGEVDGYEGEACKGTVASIAGNDHGGWVYTVQYTEDEDDEDCQLDEGAVRFAAHHAAWYHGTVVGITDGVTPLDVNEKIPDKNLVIVEYTATKHRYHAI